MEPKAIIVYHSRMEQMRDEFFAEHFDLLGIGFVVLGVVALAFFWMDSKNNK